MHCPSTTQRPTASCCRLKIHLICCSGSQQSLYKPARHLFCQARATSLILIDSTWFVSSSCQSYFKIPCVIYFTSPLPIHVASWLYVEKLVIYQIEHQGQHWFVQKRDTNQACIPIRITQAIGGTTIIQHTTMSMLSAAQTFWLTHRAILVCNVVDVEENIIFSPSKVDKFVVHMTTFITTLSKISIPYQ